MELSLFLARSWGLFAVISSLAILLNKKHFIGMIKNLNKEPMSVFVVGFFALFIGILQVIIYNSWTWDYKGLITLFGWLSLVKGIAIIGVPGHMERFAKVFAKESWYTVTLGIFFIVGAYLLYMGFK